MRQFVIVASLFCVLPIHAMAFEISTGRSSACHEKLTLNAAQEGLTDDFTVSDDIELPTTDVWNAVVESVLKDVEIEANSEIEKFIAVSLVIGSRWPDTEGHVVTGTAQIRDAHSQSLNQYNHALRAAGDDGLEGNITAISGTRERINSYLDRAGEAIELPPDEQILTRKVFVDFYGNIDIEVWAPAFYLGFASHIMQDSFSHTLRDADFREILHVLNFIEAARGDYEQSRDGLRHSGALDMCDSNVPGLTEAATEATVDLHRAFIAEQYAGDSNARKEVLDSWFGYRDDCTKANAYCGAPYLETAMEGQTRPLLSCSAAGSAATLPLVFGTLFLIVVIRRRESSEPQQ